MTNKTRIVLLHSCLTLLDLKHFICLSCFVISVRWDMKATDELPEYMKICYLAMFNFGNEIAYDVLRDHGLNVISNIKEAVRTILYN